jgi:hypothetical protein
MSIDRLSYVTALTALKKVVDDELKAERKALDDDMCAALKGDGTDRRSVIVEGSKLADISWVFTTPHPVVIDHDAFGEWLLSTNNGHLSIALTGVPFDDIDISYLVGAYPRHFYCHVVPDEGWDVSLKGGAGDYCIDAETGEVVPGVRWVGREPKHTRINLIEDAKSIIRAMGPAVTRTLLLGDGEVQ